MYLGNESAWLLVFASVQILGLLSLACTRMSNTSEWHRYFCGTKAC